MIRLGSLAGYPFEGPRLLAGYDPPTTPGVFAVLLKPDAARERYAVIYVDQADDLAQVGLPFRHPQAPCWIRRSGSKWGLHVAVHDAPGAAARHREEIVRELLSLYHPGCNTERYQAAWKEEWIGSYRAPTADPLTTSRQPRRVRPGSDAGA